MPVTSPVYLKKLPKFDYLAPHTVDEVCALLAQHQGKAKLIAGGTDLVIMMKKRTLIPQYIINLKSVAGLDYVRHSDRDGFRIGGTTTLHELETSPIIRERCPVLAATAHEMADPLIRNVATIGGNLCTASPAADLAPPLLALAARVRLKSTRGERSVSLDEFFTGPRATVLQPDEVLSEIEVPNPLPNTRAVYLKLHARTGVDLAAVGVAAAITLDPASHKVADARIALGAVAPTPIRARATEAVIRGKTLDERLLETVAETAASEARPVSDVRASAEYRIELVKVLTRRAIEQVGAASHS